MTHKSICKLLFIFIVFGLVACVIDRTPMEIKKNIDCPKTSRSTIRDYEYFVKSRNYFFIDSFYKDYFEQGLTNDMSNWVYQSERIVRELDVYISTQYSNEAAIRGIAVLEPVKYVGLTYNDYDTVTTIPGKVEKGFFIKLEEQLDYSFDYARGFFWLRVQAQSNKRIAVSFKTDEKQVGTLFTDFINNTTILPVFRLIKSTNMKSEYEEIWPLTMRNVYSLGDTAISSECFNIIIEYNLNGEHQQIQQVEPKKSYMYLLGLDRKDKNGVLTEYGDGIVDDNSLLLNRRDGVLIFPGLQPFDPLPSSRFQIADTTRAHLYDTTDMRVLSYNSKFDLLVISKRE